MVMSSFHRTKQFFVHLTTESLHNFDKYSHGAVDTLGVLYDYGSLMHYGRNYFSANGKSFHYVYLFRKSSTYVKVRSKERHSEAQRAVV